MKRVAGGDRDREGRNPLSPWRRRGRRRACSRILWSRDPAGAGRLHRMYQGRGAAALPVVSVSIHVCVNRRDHEWASFSLPGQQRVHLRPAMAERLTLPHGRGQRRTERTRVDRSDPRPRDDTQRRHRLDAIGSGVTLAGQRENDGQGSPDWEGARCLGRRGDADAVAVNRASFGLSTARQLAHIEGEDL